MSYDMGAIMYFDWVSVFFGFILGSNFASICFVTILMILRRNKNDK